MQVHYSGMLICVVHARKNYEVAPVVTIAAMLCQQVVKADYLPKMNMVTYEMLCFNVAVVHAMA